MWFAQMGAQQPSQEEMMMMQQAQAQAQAQAQGQEQQAVGEEEIMQIMQMLQQALEKGANPQDVIAELLSNQVPPEIIVQAFIKIGAPAQDAERLVMTTLEQMQNAQAQQQQVPQQEPMPMGKRGYIKKRLKQAEDGINMDQEAATASATNFAADVQPSKNALLNFNKRNIIRGQAEEEYNNMMAMTGNDSSEIPLEEARYGRARRQAKKTARKQNRQNREVNRTIRNAYGDISFPAGVAPMMMPGSPMMGGAPGVFDMEVQRGGLFNRIKNIKTHMETTGASNMPINFAQGVFTNGLYNPWAMQNSGQFMQRITYPGVTNEIETVKDKIIFKDDVSEDNGDKGGGDNTDPIITANTQPKGGCPEGYKWDPNAMAPNGKAGVCVEDKKVNPGDCTGGRIFNELSGECDCKDKNHVWDSTAGKCIPRDKTVIVPESSDNWKIPAALVAGAGIITYANRKKIAKYLVNRGVKVTKKNVNQAIADLAVTDLDKYFSNAPGDDLVPLVGRDGQLLMSFYDDADFKLAGPEIIPGSSPIDGKIVDDFIPDPAQGNLFDQPKLEVPTKHSEKQIKKMSKELNQIVNTKKHISRTKVLNFSKRHGVKIPKTVSKGSTKHLVDWLKQALKLRFEEGGEIDSMNEMYGDPDLYKFTGGGQGVNYFADTGYPESEDVYDPYMPYMEHGGPHTAAEQLAALGSTNPSIGQNLAQQRDIDAAQWVAKRTSNIQNRNPNYTEEELKPTIKNYGGDLRAGQEVWMNPNEIAAFMAIGGVVEFLD
jgi:hypothetical protein